MAKSNQLYDFMVEIEVETEKAWKVNDGTKSDWIPKSQGEYDEDTQTMTIPEWLAKEKGFI